MLKILSKFLLIILILISIVGCVTKHPKVSGAKHNYLLQQDRAPTKHSNIDISKLTDAVYKFEPKSRYGNNKYYQVNGKNYVVLDSGAGYVTEGVASWYGEKFHGYKTSSGEVYDMYAMTGAHKSLPLPTYVKVINLDNNKEIIVKVNDRGPFVEDRLIDLSYAAAVKLDMIKTGTANVKIKAITFADIADAKTFKYLQVGAFKSQQNAQKLLDKLKAEHQELVAVIKTVKMNNNNLYKVLIGPIAEQQQFSNLSRLYPDSLSVTN